jgi:hypothetical protein
MSISKYNYETIQEILCLEYEKVFKRFPNRQECSGSKHELILKIMRLKRKQRSQRNALSYT